MGNAINAGWKDAVDTHWAHQELS